MSASKSRGKSRPAAGSEQLSGGAPAKSVVREYAETIIICVLILVFARCFVFIQSKIPTESMLETLQVGDYILVNRFLYGAPGDLTSGRLGQRDIERGDVIVFRYPETPDTDYVKRVIGLPGETIEIVRGVVHVDGSRLNEPFVLPRNFDATDFGPLRIPDGDFFCMGDNRDNSRDSRVWGTVSRSLVRGRAFLIWFSYEEERGDHLNTGFGRLVSIVRKIPQLPWKTRWERIFSLIDGKAPPSKEAAP